MNELTVTKLFCDYVISKYRDAFNLWFDICDTRGKNQIKSIDEGTLTDGPRHLAIMCRSQPGGYSQRIEVAFGEQKVFVHALWYGDQRYAISDEKLVRVASDAANLFQTLDFERAALPLVSRVSLAITGNHEESENAWIGSIAKNLQAKLDEIHPMDDTATSEFAEPTEGGTKFLQLLFSEPVLESKIIEAFSAYGENIAEFRTSHYFYMQGTPRFQAESKMRGFYLQSRRF